jgi:hypothetical protein
MDEGMIKLSGLWVALMLIYLLTVWYAWKWQG